jgi:nucleoside-diphosphate-sugar epimerase
MGNWPTEQVIVTGAQGWLGFRLVQTLINGLPDHDLLRGPNTRLKVRALILPGQDAALLRNISDRVEVVEGDVRDPAACAKLCANAKGAILIHTPG